MSDDFFSGVEQVDYYALGENMKMPAFFRHSRGFMSTFPASLLKLKGILPDKRLVPAQLFPGVGAVQLLAMEHYDTDLGPHNEFAVLIPLNSPYFLQIPGYNLLRQLIQMYSHAYIRHLPVTSEMVANIDVNFGWNSFLASIDFTDSDEWLDCELKENGESICRIKSRKIPARHSRIMKMFLYTVYKQQPIFAEVVGNYQQFGLGFNPSNVELSLGTSHPIARELSQLLLSTRSLNFLYMPSFQFLFHHAEPIRLSLIKAVLGE